MKRSPRRENRPTKKEKELLDRIPLEVDEVQVTAQPAEESVKLHLDVGCSWIRPQFPEDK